MRRRILVVRRKIVEISTGGVSEDKVVIVERDVGAQKNLRGGSRRLEISGKQNSKGEFIVAEVSSSTIRDRIVIPASEYGTGWKDVTGALPDFGEGGGVKDSCKVDGQLKDGHKGTDNFKPSEKATYLQAASSRSWPVMSCEVQKSGISAWWERWRIGWEQSREPRSMNVGANTTRVSAHWWKLRNVGANTTGVSAHWWKSGNADSLHPKWPGQRSIKYVEKDRVNTKKGRWPLLDVIQRRRILGFKSGRGRLGISKVLRSDMIHGRKGGDWAFNCLRDMGGPKGAFYDVERRAGKWAKSSDSRTESRTLSPAQDVGPFMKQIVRWGEQFKLEYGRSIIWEVQEIRAVEGGFEEPNEDFEQDKKLLIENHSEDTMRERIAFDIESVECYQIDPISSARPRVKMIGQDDGGDWLSVKGTEIVSSEWARRKLKGFRKFLGISYGGMEDEAARLFARIEEQWSNRVSPRGGRSRGVGRSKGKKELKNLEWSETKLKDVDTLIIRSLWGGRWVKWKGLRANGYAGGIIMMWDSRLMTCIDFLEGVHSISCLFENVDGYRWAFAGVYGPHNRYNRLMMWEEWSGARAVRGTPWVCGGDFNVIVQPAERVGCQMQSRAMRDFLDYIREEELIEPPIGRKWLHLE
ncbi:hypothetical protein Acr_08g0011250 [Actinidia rufa]|uniref:DNAse I-like superfamily protein n=1 Tax=Actinidia rufa TaxID=165716 RepID=A0A7J0F3C6_9ERIC|nr:hypothetical protein Acr_08g0011250 [Actinidia rufa]